MKMGNQKEKEEIIKNNEEVKNNNNIKENDQMQFNELQFRVVLENNDQTSFEAVIDVLIHAFGFSQQNAFKIMMQAHEEGMCICWVGSETECVEKHADAMAYCQNRIDEYSDDYNRSHYYELLEFIVELDA